MVCTRAVEVAGDSTIDSDNQQSTNGTSKSIVNRTHSIALSKWPATNPAERLGSKLCGPTVASDRGTVNVFAKSKPQNQFPINLLLSTPGRLRRLGMLQAGRPHHKFVSP